MNFTITKILGSILGIVVTLSATSLAVVYGILSPYALILAAMACYPMAKILWLAWLAWYYDPIRLLKKNLPKVGFQITDVKLDDNNIDVQFLGTLNEIKYSINAQRGNGEVLFEVLPWGVIEAKDSRMPQFLEALNMVNANCSQTSVALCPPTEDGKRMLYTFRITPIPSFRTAMFLQHVLTDMANRPKDFSMTMNQIIAEKKPRNTVGFARPQAETTDDQAAADQPEEPLAPAADATVKS